MSEANTDLRTKLWHQIVVKDAHNLSGASTEAFLADLMREANIGWVCVRGLDGAYSGLRGSEGAALPSLEFLTKVSHAAQYDWAFFYLHRKEPSLSAVTVDDLSNIPAADVTVRLVDDQYFYIYTHEEVVKDHLLTAYPNSEYRHCSFNDLEIPY